MELVKQEQLNEIRNRWLNYRVSGTIQLSEEEIDFIQSTPVIKIGNEMDWPPFDFNTDGEPRGLSVDYMNAVAEPTGLRIRNSFV